jgi:hypothetical protein
MAVATEVLAELERAIGKFAPMHSGHEGKATIEEELDELWDEIKANRPAGPAARAEAIQVAAMAIRYVLDVCDREIPSVSSCIPPESLVQ